MKKLFLLGLFFTTQAFSNAKTTITKLDQDLIEVKTYTYTCYAEQLEALTKSIESMNLEIKKLCPTSYTKSIEIINDSKTCPNTKVIKAIVNCYNS